MDGQKAIQLQLQSLLDQMQHTSRGKSVLGEPPTAPKEQTPISKADSEFSDDQRVSLASIHLEGKAELWFQGLVEKGLPTWQQFVEEVYERFGGVDPGAILGEFNTLQQGDNTVDQYLERFEELKSHVMIFHSDFPESYYVTCFINGLRPAIKGSVISLRPTRLHQAVAFAKIQEKTVNAILQLANLTVKTTSNTKNFTTPKPHYNPIIPKPHHPPPKPLTKKPNPPAPVRRISCRRQKCRLEGFMYCILTEEEAAMDEARETPMEETEEMDMTVSINALSGNTDFNTFRVKGRAYGQELQLLIDGGSTHCFLDEETAIQLGYQLQPITPMVVSVADGRQMVSQLYCPTFTWEIQGHSFSYPTRTLTLGGCHMVLGGDWLRQYSPIAYEYKAMTVTVSKNGKKLEFKTLRQQSELHFISAKSMSKLITEKTYGFVGQLHSISAVPSFDKLSFAQDTVLNQLLAGYECLFQEPQGLPPRRDIEHQITLKPEAVSRRMQPYRYSYSQKGEIEGIVKTLLHDGIIQPSQSSFHLFCWCWEDHLEQLQLTLDLLRKHQLYAKRSKCDFGRETIEYLGHIITKEGVSTDPSKVECMKNWAQPRNIKELRGFLD
ncbi:UNVERIFIED_CONTAM: putative mitochondrial protein [Sesamum angustifolium]|uniref:Mitochondrial protein n=1 Tax=Sesamum angustifolium TaxID=2727405 RepID=A0AAW2QTU6_9LAMI